MYDLPLFYYHFDLISEQEGKNILFVVSQLVNHKVSVELIDSVYFRSGKSCSNLFVAIIGKTSVIEMLIFDQSIAYQTEHMFSYKFYRRIKQ